MPQDLRQLQQSSRGRPRPGSSSLCSRNQVLWSSLCCCRRQPWLTLSEACCSNLQPTVSTLDGRGSQVREAGRHAMPGQCSPAPERLLFGPSSRPHCSSPTSRPCSLLASGPSQAGLARHSPASSYRACPHYACPPLSTPQKHLPPQWPSRLHAREARALMSWVTACVSSSCVRTSQCTLLRLCTCPPSPSEAGGVCLKSQPRCCVRAGLA